MGPLATPVRFCLIALVLIGVAALFAFTGGWLSPERLTQSRMLDGLQTAGGIHPGFRRNHAKGLCFSGTFASSGEAAPWSKATVFAPGTVPVIGRFAMTGGMPFQTDRAATVRSMAVRFVSADGAEWRTGMNNIPVFVVNTPQAFYEQSLASAPDPATGKPDPAAMQAFASRHPEFTRAIALIKAHAPSAGFADSVFNSLDAFRFVNAAGTSTAVRWAMVPLQPAVLQANSPDDDSATPVALTGQNRLFDDLIVQVHEQPLRWRLVVTLAEPSDPTADATLPWPNDRRHVDAGILTVAEVSSEDNGPCTEINFDPLVLPAGIEPSDDPLLSARSAVYALSHTLRSAERSVRPPSAVTPREVAQDVKP
jgi:catalase